MRRPRRLVPIYRATCNGGDDNRGCAFLTVEARYLPEIRRIAAEHARTAQHEAVVQNLNDGLVLDGRPPR